MPDPAAPLVLAPAPFVPEQAIAFGGAGTAATPVDPAHPLPIQLRVNAAAATPLTGTTAASGSFGPYAPDLGRAIWLTLSGSWAGTVQVLRSTDGGTTKLPLTAGGAAWASFTANVNEAIGEESVAAATYWLAVTLSSGTLAYRVQQ